MYELEKREARIEALYEEIEKLKAISFNETREEILPFLQKYCTLVWCRSGAFEIVCPDREIEKQLIDLIQGRENRGFHHFGCDISDHVHMRYDDGTISINFHIPGNVHETMKAVIEETKRMNLKVDFTNARIGANNTLARAQATLNEVQNMESQYQNKTSVVAEKPTGSVHAQQKFYQV